VEGGVYLSVGYVGWEALQVRMTILWEFNENTLNKLALMGPGPPGTHSDRTLMKFAVFHDD
jgi:hypothetical protein